MEDEPKKPGKFGLKEPEPPSEPKLSPLEQAESYAGARVTMTADNEPFDFEVAAEREAEAEEMLGRGMSPRHVRSALAKKYRVTRQHASTWVQAVHRTWRAESTPEERESIREQIKETAWHGVHLAFTRKGMALDRDGVEHFYNNPDVAAARAMLETLASVSGLRELEQKPMQFNLTLQQQVTGALTALRGHYFAGSAPVVDALPEGTDGGGDGER